jgi:hypothetical protein
VLLSIGMRKRWLLILLGVTALIVGLALAWPRPPDELADLRRFDPEITLRQVVEVKWKIHTKSWYWDVRFKEASPELFKVLRIPASPNFYGECAVTLPNGMGGTYVYFTHKLKGLITPKPSLNDLKWLFAKRLLGIENVQLASPVCTYYVGCGTCNQGQRERIRLARKARKLE